MLISSVFDVRKWPQEIEYDPSYLAVLFHTDKVPSGTDRHSSPRSHLFSPEVDEFFNLGNHSWSDQPDMMRKTIRRKILAKSAFSEFEGNILENERFEIDDEDPVVSVVRKTQNCG